MDDEYFLMHGRQGLYQVAVNVQTRKRLVLSPTVSIVSSRKINVLGVIFDQKLQWSDHVAHCIQKSRKALTAIRLIKIFFHHKRAIAADYIKFLLYFVLQF